MSAFDDFEDRLYKRWFADAKDDEAEADSLPTLTGVKKDRKKEVKE